MNSPTGKNKLKIYVDEVKLRHTTHWDLDFLSRKELDEVMGAETPGKQREDKPESADGTDEPTK